MIQFLIPLWCEMWKMNIFPVTKMFNVSTARRKISDMLQNLPSFSQHIIHKKKTVMKEKSLEHKTAPQSSLIIYTASYVLVIIRRCCQYFVTVTRHDRELKWNEYKHQSCGRQGRVHHDVDIENQSKAEIKCVSYDAKSANIIIDLIH